MGRGTARRAPTHIVAGLNPLYLAPNKVTEPALVSYTLSAETLPLPDGRGSVIPPNAKLRAKQVAILYRIASSSTSNTSIPAGAPGWPS
jgi:hypothetical protein